MSARITSRPGIRPANGLSHVAGSTDRPLIDATIPGFLAEVVRRHGPRTAAVFRQTGDRWSYDEFARLMNRLAAGLLSIGVYKGDRVGIWAPNRPEWLLAQFATARIGAILVNINPAYRTSELDYALNKVGVSALIVAPQFKSSDYMAMLTELAPEMATCPPGRLRAARLPSLQAVVQLGPNPRAGALAFEDLMERGNRAVRTRLDAISASLHPDDAINIQFTSGTTGAPKGATLSHRNIVNNAISTARCMRLQPGEGLCIPVPFYHCFGMVLGNLAACAYGARMVIPGEAFDARDTLAAIDAEGCAALHGVPTMFQAMLDHPEFQSFDMRSLRTGIMAGAPCPEPLMRRVIERMHCDQTSPISFQSAVDDPVDRRVSTVGRIQPHVECKVVDDQGRTLPVGQQGELLTRGYLVMKGYWNDPDRTAEALRGGWMHTVQGHADPWWRKRLSGRGGRVSDHPSRHRAGAGLWPARSEIRRGGCALGDPASGGAGDSRGFARLVQGQDRPLQDPAPYPVRGRNADDRHWQATEIRDARHHDGRTGPEGLNRKGRRRCSP